MLKCFENFRWALTTRDYYGHKQSLNATKKLYLWYYVFYISLIILMA